MCGAPPTTCPLKINHCDHEYSPVLAVQLTHQNQWRKLEYLTHGFVRSFLSLPRLSTLLGYLEDLLKKRCHDWTFQNSRYLVANAWSQWGNRWGSVCVRLLRRSPNSLSSRGQSLPRAHSLLRWKPSQKNCRTSIRIRPCSNRLRIVVRVLLAIP